MRLGIALLVALLLVLTVPWFFIGTSPREVAGWPLWAVYTLGMNVIFAVLTALLLGRCWDRFEGDAQKDKDPS